MEFDEPEGGGQLEMCKTVQDLKWRVSRIAEAMALAQMHDFEWQR